MKIRLIGAGRMAQEYAKVLKALGAGFTAHGRGEASATAFEAATGVPVSRGLPEGKADAAIVAVGVSELSEVARSLKAGRMLVEKPAGLTLPQIAALKGAKIAYNRRFYASTLKARELIREDGGATSFSFEFGERADRVAASSHPAEVKRKWMLCNSTHAIDLAFYLGGELVSVSGTKAGKLPWHPSGSRWAGAGKAKSGAIFSYRADWGAPGRWGVEVMTRRRRLVLQPLEQLFVQEHASFELKPVALDDALDREYKPGLYRQVQAFLNGSNELLTASEHAKRLKSWRKIGVEI